MPAKTTSASDTTPPVGGLWVAVKIECSNDRNGNPRRGWLVREVVPGQQYGGDGPFFVDEGYHGTSRLGEQFPGVVVVCTVAVTPAEYRERCRLGGGA